MARLKVPPHARCWVPARFDRSPGQTLPQLIVEPSAVWLGVGFDVVRDEDGLHDRGRAAWAAAQRLHEPVEAREARVPRDPHRRDPRTATGAPLTDGCG